MTFGYDTDSFQPHPLLRNGHLQTIVPSYLQRPVPEDWEKSGEKTFILWDGSAVSCRYLIRNSSAPTLFALHGMAGSNRSRYIRGQFEKTRLLGWNFFSPSLYDVSRSRKKPTIFHSGCSSHVNDLLHQAKKKLDLEVVLLSGVSMGGNILLKMLGEWGPSYPDWVLGAAAISPLTDIPGSCLRLEAPSAYIYRKRFVRNLQDTMLRDAVRYQGYLNSENVLKARSIHQFDEAFTAPLSGFASPEEYYETQSSQGLLSSIRLPTYIIHSLDDPILTCQALQSQDVQDNPSITLCLTKRGGHVGFFSSRPEERYWAEGRIMEYLRERTD